MEPFVLGIIPARYDSQRFPGKPLADLHGKPIIQHTWEAVKRAQRLDDILIATDDDRIAIAAKAFGANVVMTSPNCPSGSDRVEEAMRAWELQHGHEVTAVANIQGDEPMIDPNVIDAAVERLIRSVDGVDPDVTTVMTPLRTRDEVASPNNVKVVFDMNMRALYFSRAAIPNLVRSSARDLGAYYDYLAKLGIGPDEKIYGFKHLGLYVFRRMALLGFTGLDQGRLERLEKLEQLRLLEVGMGIYLVPSSDDSPGIDTPTDLEIARKLMSV